MLLPQTAALQPKAQTASSIKRPSPAQQQPAVKITNDKGYDDDK